MKINSIEVDTDLGRRLIQISPPLDVDPAGDMPPPFRSLTDLLWNVLCQIATKGPELAKAASKVEA